MAQNDRQILSGALLISETIHHMIVILVHLCKIFLKVFFSFFKVLIFQFGRGRGGGVKGQKIVQNNKKFDLLRDISQEQY